MRLALLTIVTVSGSTLALAAQGRTDFEFRRSLPAGRSFHLQNIIGDVAVTGTTGRDVVVTATKRAGRHGDPEDVLIETVELNDGVALCVRYPNQYRRRSSERDDDGKPRSPCSTNSSWGNTDRNDTEVTFTVRVPAGLVLNLGTVSGDVMASNLDGEIELRSVSGDVRLDGGRGETVELTTVSGNVELLDIRGRDVTGHTISGRVTFRGAIMDKGAYDFSTTSGDITLNLPENPNATLSAATFSGRFSSDLATTQKDGRRRRARHDAVWGNGSARLDVESLSGDIRITTTR